MTHSKESLNICACRRFEFESEVTNGKIGVPAEVLNAIPDAKHCKIILLVNESEDVVWSKATTQSFASGYDDNDSIYDVEV